MGIQNLTDGTLVFPPSGEGKSFAHMATEYGEDECMKWERVLPPLWWPAAKAMVVSDRHLPDGTRQHMVHGSVKPGLVVANAQVIGQDDVPRAEFSAVLSHLSK